MADEKVTNKLVVQGKTSREYSESQLGVAFLYKGEELPQEEQTQSTYGVNDVVANKKVSGIEFSIYNGSSFDDFEEFPSKILNSKFENESAYYENVNNAFNVCRTSFLNLISCLQPFSSTNDVLYKDAGYLVVSNSLKNGLENMVKYHFYEKLNLKNIYIKEKDDKNIKIAFNYNKADSKNTFSTQETDLTFRINDVSLIFDNETLKHRTQTNYADNYTSSESEWGKTIGFPIYTLDKYGHITNIEYKYINLPYRPKLQKTVLYSGNDNSQGKQFNIDIDDLHEYFLIELIFKYENCGITIPATSLFTSVFIDTNIVPSDLDGTIKFKGVKIVNTQVSYTDHYGNRRYYTVTYLETEEFGESYCFPKNTYDVYANYCLYNKIVKIIGYKKYV